MAIITLCGSARFEQLFNEWNEKLSLEGNCVFSLAVQPSAKGGKKDWYTTQQKDMLDRVHLAKIRASDSIMVLNKDGYIGESTAREINHAKSLGKRIRYLEEPTQSVPPISERMELQTREFDACQALVTAYQGLPPIVDDDYPDCRRRYERAVQDFIDAIRANGRLDAKAV